MEDQAYIMSTSMFQYMEEMDHYLAKRRVSKDQRDLVEDTHNSNGVDLDMQMNANFEPNVNGNIDFAFKIDTNEPEELFNTKLYIDDEDAEIENEDVKSNVPDQISFSNNKSEDKNSTNSKEEETPGVNKTTMSNKERARKARQRKKKYYEDLEKRVIYLESKCKSLTKELDYCQKKIQLYEGNDWKVRSKQLAAMNVGVFDKFEEHIKNWPEKDEGMANLLKKMDESHGPFGVEKLKLLENSFDMFLENIMSGSGFKMCIYAVDKDVPSKYEDYVSFNKMTKFQQHEKYPDNNISEFIRIKSMLFNNKYDFTDFYNNTLAIFRQAKTEIKEGISILNEGRIKIYKALMKYDMNYLLLSNRVLDKNVMLCMMQEIKHSWFNISYKEALDIEEKTEEVEQRLVISDPQAYRRMRIKSLGMAPTDEHPTEFLKKYTYTNIEFIK
jgi:molecular chaperone GrpE (heat shock protein)